MFNDEERSLSLGAEKSDAEIERIADAILAFLTGCQGPASRVEIEGHVEGKTKHKRTALKRLVESGKVAECGAGAKGDPFRYYVQRTKERISLDSCSSHIEGTREQPSQNPEEVVINSGDILVPDTAANSPETAKPLEKEFLNGRDASFPSPRGKSCYVHGYHHEWWKQADGTEICGKCHPNPGLK